MVIAATVLVIGIAASIWMFMDLSAKGKVVNTLAREVASKKQQVDQLPPSSGKPDTAEDAGLAERFNRIVMAPDAIPQLQEQISQIAVENNLENFSISSDVTQLDTASTGIDANALTLLGVKRSVMISISFRADYADMARFLGAINKLPQSLIVRTVSLRRLNPKLESTVAVQVYQRGA